MKKEEVDRRRGGQTKVKSGQRLTLRAQLAQLKTGRGGKLLLQSLLWCPDDLASHGIDQTRLVVC